MFFFLIGFATGGILGIILISILSIGAVSDERMEIMSRNFDKFNFEGKETFRSKQ